jgi:hypothetical protein
LRRQHQLVNCVASIKKNGLANAGEFAVAAEAGRTANEQNASAKKPGN